MLHDMKEDATNADDVVDVEGNIEPPTGLLVQRIRDTD